MADPVDRVGRAPPSASAPTRPGAPAPVGPSASAPTRPGAPASVQPSAPPPVRSSAQAPAQLSPPPPVRSGAPAPVQPSPPPPARPAAKASSQPSAPPPVQPAPPAPAPRRDVRATMRSRIASPFRRFWRIAWDANLTGNSAMVAYNMLLGIIPIALLGLFVAGQVLSSTAVQHSVVGDLREVFPGATAHTLDSLLGEITSSTTSTGVLALIASLWLGSSFWGALDPALAQSYGCRSRPG